jgi:NET1-associated nuclear protein 1 (U3 small nucleolar RNA-associated protein 17)
MQISLIPQSNSKNSSQIKPVGKTRFPTGLVISPSGEWLVATAGHKVYVASTAAQKSGFTKYVSPEKLTCLAFHPSEQYFATGDAKGCIRVWYCLSQNTLPTTVKGVEKKTNTTTLHWHAHAVSSITFTPNGAYLLSGGEEAVLVIWQLRTGRKEFVPRVGAPINTVSINKSEGVEEEYLLGLADATHLFVSSGTLRILRSYPTLKIGMPTYACTFRATLICAINRPTIICSSWIGTSTCRPRTLFNTDPTLTTPLYNPDILSSHISNNF